MKNPKLVLILALAAFALVGSPEHSDATPGYYVASAAATPLAQEACWLCDWCDAGHTKTEQQARIAIIGFDIPRYCDWGLCQGPFCSMGSFDQEAMTVVWDAAREGDIERLRAMLAMHPEVVWLNVTRSAIQFSSHCDPDVVVGSIPVAEAVADALAAQ